MAHSVIFINNDSAYLARKHLCPNCQMELNKIKVSKIVNSRSEEAKNMPKMHSQTMIGSRGIKFRSYNYVGNVKYVWKELECPNCHLHFTVDQMKEIEGITSSSVPERSPQELKRIKIKKLIFNWILPIVTFALIAFIIHFVTKP